jgi:hypothetical protein
MYIRNHCPLLPLTIDRSLGHTTTIQFLNHVMSQQASNGGKVDSTKSDTIGTDVRPPTSPSTAISGVTYQRLPRVGNTYNPRGPVTTSQDPWLSKCGSPVVTAASSKPATRPSSVSTEKQKKEADDLSDFLNDFQQGKQKTMEQSGADRYKPKEWTPPSSPSSGSVPRSTLGR